MYRYGIDKESTIFRYDLIDQLGCIMFKCHILLYVELIKIHVYMYSYGIDEGTTTVRYDLIDRLHCNGIRE